MGLDWAALLSFLFASVYLCSRPSSPVCIISPEKSEADFSCFLLALRSEKISSVLVGDKEWQTIAFVPYLWAAGPRAVFVLLWIWSLLHPVPLCSGLSAHWVCSILTLLCLRQELRCPADSSIVLEVVHQLFFSFSLTFLTVAWSELYTSNATLGYKSVYPFQVTSSKMPNSKKGGLRTCCIALMSKWKNSFFMARWLGVLPSIKKIHDI